jgi:hypothetical protein
LVNGRCGLLLPASINLSNSSQYFFVLGSPFFLSKFDLFTSPVSNRVLCQRQGMKLRDLDKL